jgi:PAS domain S-box-containing protein
MQQVIESANTIQSLIDELPVGYMEVDRDGRILRVNSACCRMQGMSSEKMLGQTPWDYMALDEVERSLETFRSVIDNGAEPVPVHRTIYTATGEYYTYEIHRGLMRDADGVIIGMRLVYFDVTDTKEAHEEAHTTRLWLESVLVALDEAVIVTDALGFVRLMNPAAETLTGWKATELRGRSIQSGCPILKFTPLDQNQAHVRMGLDGPCKGQARILNRNREELTVFINASPIFDPEQGYTTGVVQLWRAA